MPARAKEFEAAHFAGMRFVADTSDWDGRYVYRALNLLPSRGIYQFRPGDESWVVNAAATPTAQCEHVLRKHDGTVIDLMVAGGEIYTRDTSGTAWTKKVTTANLTTAAVTLSSSAVVYSVTFNNTVVLTDGTNKPFTWDGTAGAGGVVPLTNAPVAYGAPTVYYAKLFFVKNSDRVTIVWSEEAAANTGYEAGGFNNAWSLRQTEQAAPLTAILGTNEALVYWRAHSIGSIRGAVTPTFSADGTHDAISSVIGTTAPKSVLFHETYIWFTDSFGKPWRLHLGGEPEPVWQAMDTFNSLDDAGSGTAPQFFATDIAVTIIVPYPGIGGVLVAYSPFNVTGYSRMFVFSAETGVLWGEVDFSTTYITNPPVLLAAGVVGTSGDDLAVLSVSGVGSGATALNNQTSPRALSSGNYFSGNAAERSVMFGPVGKASGQYQWDLVDLFLDLAAGGWWGSPASVTLNINSTNNIYDSSSSQGSVSVQGSASVHKTVRAVWGLSAELRFLQPKVVLPTTPIAIQSLKVTGYPVPLMAGAT